MATQGLMVYSAKFVCGVFDQGRRAEQAHVEGPVRPGSYSTAINVHNPDPRRGVSFRKKAVLLYVGSEPVPSEEFERPVPPHGVHSAELGPDFGMEIDCTDIRRVLLATPNGPGPAAPIFIKGWVVIECPAGSPLDVVAVYTAHGFAADGTPEGFSIETERVPGSLIG